MSHRGEKILRRCDLLRVCGSTEVPWGLQARLVVQGVGPQGPALRQAGAGDASGVRHRGRSGHGSREPAPGGRGTTEGDRLGPDRAAAGRAVPRRVRGDRAARSEEPVRLPALPRRLHPSVDRVVRVRELTTEVVASWQHRLAGWMVGSKGRWSARGGRFADRRDEPTRAVSSTRTRGLKTQFWAPGPPVRLSGAERRPVQSNRVAVAVGYRR